MISEVIDSNVIKDRKIAVLTSIGGILGFLLITFLIRFAINPPLPIDVPPLNSDEVIEMFEIDNVQIQASRGGTGGGTPADAKVDKPQAQTEQILTKNSPNGTEHRSGKSDFHSDNNSDNPTSTVKKSNDPFGTGGGDSGEGTGRGGKFGSDEGTHGTGPGGNGNGDGRVRLNEPNVDNIQSDVSCKVGLKLTINADGQVVSAVTVSKNTTTSDQRIVNQVKNAVINQVRYNKVKGAGLEAVYLTVKVDAK